MLGQAAERAAARSTVERRCTCAEPNWRADVAVPTPPFWGARMIEAVPLQTLVPYLNETMLYQFQWGYPKAGPDAGGIPGLGARRNCGRSAVACC